MDIEVAKRVKHARMQRWITKGENRKLMEECYTQPEKVMEYINKLVTLHKKKWTWSEYIPAINLSGLIICIIGYVSQQSICLMVGIMLIMVGNADGAEWYTPLFE